MKGNLTIGKVKSPPLS